jgi:hypothetical protein
MTPGTGNSCQGALQKHEAMKDTQQKAVLGIPKMKR